ncbi:hypothetical protein J2X16_000507 [Pelomonas aquatica]|uniref:Uncharacterized protein n=1 Tax=Pelomonas aquatica TaxID=431058 RepID=A0ABU1Z586_9BURK|nr:hypothetical protein [Pelomonas aquatica]
MRGSKRQHGLRGLALAQHDGDDGKNDEPKVKEDLKQGLLVQVMVEYSNH